MILLISLFVLAPIVWILFSPIVLRIDTRKDLYWLRWRGIALFQLKWLDDDLVLHLRVWFWKKDFHLLESLVKPRKASDKKEASKGKAKKKRNWKRLSRRLLQSFTVKQFDLNLDTDDYVLNSYLYPIFSLLHSKPWQLGINYQGQSSLQIQIENRLIRLLKAVLL